MLKKLLFLLLVAYLTFAVPCRFSATPVWGQGDVSQEDAEQADGLWLVLRDFMRSLDQIFHPMMEIISPIPLRLGLGVKPHPEPAFKSHNEGGVLGVQALKQAGSVFVQEQEDGVRVYSLTGDFYGGDEKIAAVKPSKDVAMSASREEVWGERIAFAEEEVKGWSKDSGVVLILLATAGLAFLVVLFTIVRRIW